MIQISKARSFCFIRNPLIWDSLEEEPETNSSLGHPNRHQLLSYSSWVSEKTSAI
jgi:hypothetical protein